MINNYSLPKFRKVTLFKSEPAFPEVNGINFHALLMEYYYNKLENEMFQIRDINDIVNSKHPSAYVNGVKQLIK